MLVGFWFPFLDLILYIVTNTFLLETIDLVACHYYYDLC